MTFSYIDHRLLTAEDIATFEQRVAAYHEYGGHPPREEPLANEWVMTICMTLTAPDGQLRESEGVFKRWGSTRSTPNGGTHTEFVLMQFNAQGEARPDHGHGARAAAAPRPASAGTTRPVPPPAPPSGRGR
ncbi:hypothetical protein ACIQ7D_10195 [Streptomyces sp. NPDC096310]|uniref:hypothetical protein n=1 Tax=Streptomyces sp. NPDC096310 TaxID=3366082 RepID=UPI0038225E71